MALKVEWFGIGRRREDRFRRRDRRASTNSTRFRWNASLPWAPTVDGAVLPESPFRAGAPAVSAKVPLLVGSTRTEIGVGWDWLDFEAITAN